MCGNNHEKDYVVTVDQPITDDFIKKMSSGIPVLDTVTQKCKVTKLSGKTFQIVLTQGLNRQIRRMCEYLGYEVLKLKRTRIMNVQLDTLHIGEWRDLSEKELKEINAMVSSSSKTEEASADDQKKKPTPKKKPSQKPNAFTKKSAAFRKNSPKSRRNSTSSSRKKRR